MNFGCILETRVKESKAEGILNKVFEGWSHVTNYAHSNGGGIWLVWRDEVCMSPVCKTDQFITCSVGLVDQEEFFFTSVYTSNTVDGRKSLWEDLCQHHDSALFKNKAWIVVGDFNEILEVEESSGFENLASLPSGMRDFQQMVLHCKFSDMGYQGPLFTWCNKREEGLICKKLDRVLMNEDALQRFSSAYSVFEGGGCSDHMRCKIQLLPATEKIKKPFKYVNAMGNLEGFIPMVKEFWDNTQRLYHSTSAMFRFSKKMKNLKPLIREFGRQKLGNLSKRAKEAHGILCEKQKQTLMAPNAGNIREEAEAYEKWLHISCLEEVYLKQKAKLHWLDVGDQNNKTYHNAIRTRQAHNTIREIRCPNGSIATKQSEIKMEAERFFSDFLNQTPESFSGTTVEELQNLLEFRCSEEECKMLVEEVTEEEIRKVLFAMPSNKSPGPDGFPREFFKTTWSILGRDFIVAVQSVFKFGFLPKGVTQQFWPWSRKRQTPWRCATSDPLLVAMSSTR